MNAPAVLVIIMEHVLTTSIVTSVIVTQGILELIVK